MGIVLAGCRVSIAAVRLDRLFKFTQIEAIATLENHMFKEVRHAIDRITLDRRTNPNPNTEIDGFNGNLLSNNLDPIGENMLNRRMGGVMGS